MLGFFFFFFFPLCGFILGFLAWVVFVFVFVGYIRVACFGCFVFVFLGYIRVACLGCCCQFDLRSVVICCSLLWVGDIRVLDNLKEYSVKALVNAVDHLGTVAYKFNDLLSHQTSEISTTELRAASLAQVINDDHDSSSQPTFLL